MSAEPEPGGFDAFLVPREFGAVFRLSGSQIPLMRLPANQVPTPVLGRDGDEIQHIEWRLDDGSDSSGAVPENFITANNFHQVADVIRSSLKRLSAEALAEENTRYKPETETRKPYAKTRSWSDTDDEGIRLWVQERSGKSGGWKELAEAWASRGLSSPAPTEAQIEVRWQRHVSPKAVLQRAEKASQPSKPYAKTRSWSDTDNEGIRQWVLERGRSGGWKELAEAWVSRGLPSPAPTERQIEVRWQRHVSPKAEKEKAEKASQPSKPQTKTRKPYAKTRSWSDTDNEGIRQWVLERGGRSGGWKKLAEAWASRGLPSPAPTETQIAHRWQRHVSPKAEKEKAEKASQPSKRRPNKRRGRESEEPEKGKPSKRKAT